MAILFADSFDSYLYGGYAGSLYVRGEIRNLVPAGYEIPSEIPVGANTSLLTIVGSDLYAASQVSGNGKNGSHAIRIGWQITGSVNNYAPYTPLTCLKRKFQYNWERFIVFGAAFKLGSDAMQESIEEKFPFIKFGPITAYTHHVTDLEFSQRCCILYANDSAELTRLFMDCWYYLELEVNQEEGKLRLWLNNVKLWEADSTDFSVDAFEFCLNNGAGSKPHVQLLYSTAWKRFNGWCDVDCVVLSDGSGTTNNTRLGKVNVSMFAPQQDTVKEFEGNVAGDHFPLVSDMATSSGNTNVYDYRYVQSDDVGATDLFKRTAFTEAKPIKAVVIQTAAKLTEPSGLRLSPMAKQGETEVIAGIIPLKAADWSVHNTVLSADLNGNPWSVDSILNLNWGFKLQARLPADIPPGPVLPEYPDTGPGPQGLIGGDLNAGFYGEVSDQDLLAMGGNDLAALGGLTAGVAWDSVATYPGKWLKFAHKGKTLFYAKTPIRTSNSGVNILKANLTAQNLVYGREIEINGYMYSLRLMRGSTVDPYNSILDTDGSEWNDLMYKISATSGVPDKWTNYPDADICIGSSAYNTCMESNNSAGYLISRGNTYVFDVITAYQYCRWRPVLELLYKIETPVEPTVDYGPGSQTLLAGNLETEGFFGELAAADFITGSALSSAVGLSAGTPQNSDTAWLKFICDGKVLFVPKKTLCRAISWDHIYQAGLVYGVDGYGQYPRGAVVNQNKIITIGEYQFKVRLLKGAESDPTSQADTTGSVLAAATSEYSRLIYQVSDSAIGTWAGYTDSDLGLAQSTWCQETHSGNTALRVMRSSTGNINSFLSRAADNTDSYRGWRPVLELIGQV